MVSKRLERPKRRLGVCTRQRVCASGSDVQYSYYQGNSWALKVSLFFLGRVVGVFFVLGCSLVRICVVSVVRIVLTCGFAS